LLYLVIKWTCKALSWCCYLKRVLDRRILSIWLQLLKFVTKSLKVLILISLGLWICKRISWCITDWAVLKSHIWWLNSFLSCLLLKVILITSKRISRHIHLILLLKSILCGALIKVHRLLKWLLKWGLSILRKRWCSETLLLIYRLLLRLTKRVKLISSILKRCSSYWIGFNLSRIALKRTYSHWCRVLFIRSSTALHKRIIFLILSCF